MAKTRWGETRTPDARIGNYIINPNGLGLLLPENRLLQAAIGGNQWSANITQGTRRRSRVSSRL
jgi:hypothetical protein